MKDISRLALLVCLLAALSFAAGPTPEKPNPGEELLRAADVSGQYGGRLSVGGRAEPKTFNPVIATDAVSREITGRLMADLIEINRSSQQTRACAGEILEDIARRSHLHPATAQGHPFFRRASVRRR